MAHILTLNQAVRLDELLTQVDTQGLTWQILPFNGELPLIAGIGSLSDAAEHEIGFLANPKFFDLLQVTQASAVILPQRAIDALPANLPFAIVQCENPYLLYARITQWFDKWRTAHDIRGIHESAVIHPGARLGVNVSIHAHAVIEEGVIIGDGVTIGAGCVIGKHCIIGTDTLLHANVTLYHGVSIGQRCIIHSGAVIGADGFGFAPDATVAKGGWSKIAQLGGVIIEDDVEIGANTTVDRGALGNTVIHQGVKLDNQIMIAHNCEIGAYTAMAACVGVAGSTKIGERCTLAGASMVAGHLTIGDDVHISGGTGVMSNIDKPGRYTGLWPIMEHRDWQKNAATLVNLYELRRRIQELEKRLDATSQSE
ncbi:UDP-3-O-(3-hydroxymyristoyl)glucosamine N-acyltransferase [Pelistega europaea]|uniref:UDP-3-O-acylglucosamine N-acyltransferase n=1 Tax=Pelistega europaea TaxID=106147 RepID=A0A7Y4LAY4_9BURK|nr:UDP-3-O-(3-hydroxymyristoyl)glucosamine N-acyltransferase [Pelistega europaea]NOL48971.1 UDP-3-O-(3-hydroxymyristoyl)glucosamine N-acyltransferase [Pelistega europaea]